jgi:hypothetical protein
MQNPIVPESKLRPVQRTIEAFAAEHARSYSIQLDNSDYKSAFYYYLFFLHHPSVSDVLRIELDGDARFYNAYYWFQRFTKMHMINYGYDAGLEQQSFKMLEGADFDLDLEVIDMIDKKANE